MCGGCKGAVERVLSKLDGVEKYTIDMDTKKVVVSGSLEPEAVLNAVSKTGKKTELWT